MKFTEEGEGRGRGVALFPSDGSLNKLFKKVQYESNSE